MRDMLNYQILSRSLLRVIVRLKQTGPTDVYENRENVRPKLFDGVIVWHMQYSMFICATAAAASVHQNPAISVP